MPVPACSQRDETVREVQGLPSVRFAGCSTLLRVSPERMRCQAGPFFGIFDRHQPELQLPFSVPACP